MTAAPPSIVAVIEEFEAELRQIETRGGLLRDTIAKLRDIWDVSTMVPDRQASTPPVQFTPPLSEQLRRTPPKPAPKAQVETDERPKRSPAGYQQAQMTRVLKAAATIPQPFRAAQLHMKVSDIRRETLKDYLAAFVKAKELIKTGERAGTKYTVASNVDVSRLPASPAPPIAKSTAPAITGQELAAAAKRVFASGASYEIRELVRHLRGDFPDLRTETVESFITNLVESRQIERLPSVPGVAPRYRKRAA